MHLPLRDYWSLLALLFLGAAFVNYLLTLALTYLSEDVGCRHYRRWRAQQRISWKASVSAG